MQPQPEWPRLSNSNSVEIHKAPKQTCTQIAGSYSFLLGATIIEGRIWTSVAWPKHHDQDVKANPKPSELNVNEERFIWLVHMHEVCMT